MDFFDSIEREETILAYKSIDPNLDFDVDYNFYYGVAPHRYQAKLIQSQF
ncbi:hypothetical protein [Bacillus cereus]|nr:hypothetical protein [Bacillus cereus]